VCDFWTLPPSLRAMLFRKPCGLSQEVWASTKQTHEGRWNRNETRRQRTREAQNALDLSERRLARQAWPPESATALDRAPCTAARLSSKASFRGDAQQDDTHHRARRSNRSDASVLSASPCVCWGSYRVHQRRRWAVRADAQGRRCGAVWSLVNRRASRCARALHRPRDRLLSQGESAAD